MLRVGLIAVITALLMLFMPFIVALLFAIIVQLPLAWLLFAGPRRRVNEAMAVSSAHRRAERERLRAALAGETRRSTANERRADRAAPPHRGPTLRAGPYGLARSWHGADGSRRAGGGPDSTGRTGPGWRMRCG